MEANNMKAMREAIIHMISTADSIAKCLPESMASTVAFHINLIRRSGNAALALPRRNCDVGTAEEQKERFKSAMCDMLPKCRPWDECCLTCLAKWEQMPYEANESEAK